MSDTPMRKTLAACDVDTDELANRLERLADGIRGDGIFLVEAESGHKTKLDEMSKFELRLKYAVTHDSVDVIDPIGYVTDKDEDSGKDVESEEVRR